MSGDEKVIEHIARRFIERNGEVEALEMLRELAEQAQEEGNRVSAQTWRDIAVAVERLAVHC